MAMAIRSQPHMRERGGGEILAFLSKILQQSLATAKNVPPLLPLQVKRPGCGVLVQGGRWAFYLISTYYLFKNYNLIRGSSRDRN